MRTFRDLYPHYEEVHENGEIYYMVTIALGGRDEYGEYELVLDGPAEGEKVYLNG